MILHTLHAMSPSASFQDCLRTAQPEDTVVLLGDGVYNAIAGSHAADLLAASPVRVVALNSDAAAAGLQGKLGDTPVVSMDDFVALSEHYPRHLAWY